MIHMIEFRVDTALKAVEVLIQDPKGADALLREHKQGAQAKRIDTKKSGQTLELTFAQTKKFAKACVVALVIPAQQYDNVMREIINA